MNIILWLQSVTTSYCHHTSVSRLMTPTKAQSDRTIIGLLARAGASASQSPMPLPLLPRRQNNLADFIHHHNLQFNLVNMEPLHKPDSVILSHLRTAQISSTNMATRKYFLLNFHSQQLIQFSLEKQISPMMCIHIINYLATGRAIDKLHP